MADQIDGFQKLRKARLFEIAMRDGCSCVGAQVARELARRQAQRERDREIRASKEKAA